MLALVLTAALAATPRPLPNPQAGVFVPRLDRLDGVTAFMAHAGKRSVLLRPSTWFAEFHPLLYVDPTRADSLRQAGIDPRGSATVSTRGDGKMTCVELASPKAFQQRADDRLQSMGTLTRFRISGVPVVAAKSGSGVFVAGYARRGKVGCAVRGSGDAKALLHSAAQAVRAPPSPPGWSLIRGLGGQVFLLAGGGAVGVSATADRATLDGRAPRLSLPTLQRRPQSPYAHLQPQGLLFARAAVAPADVPGVVHGLADQLLALCSACDAKQARTLADALAQELTGDVAVNLAQVEVHGRLSTRAQRYFAAKHAWLAQVKDPKRVQQALQAVASWPGARPAEHGFALKLDGGEVRLGLVGDQLFLANDEAALRSTLAALAGSKPGRMAHGAELTADPKAIARALGRISLMDVLGSREVAGLFAISTELGPLLTLTRDIQGWAEGPRGAHRFGGTWTLQPQVKSAAPDGGTGGASAGDADGGS